MNNVERSGTKGFWWVIWGVTRRLKWWVKFLFSKWVCCWRSVWMPQNIDKIYSRAKLLLRPVNGNFSTLINSTDTWLLIGAELSTIGTRSTLLTLVKQRSTTFDMLHYWRRLEPFPRLPGNLKSFFVFKIVFKNIGDAKRTEKA